ncbi:MAG: biotin--[acetyl-CoA-carboxylase] ligase [Deltaproteobacteria bacterium]|nr:biotin--[acetyl-CoA-carboxylase] ligase [Deltaproteobacteria bacterium]
MDTRERLLGRLKEMRGAWVSGGGLSRELCLTRSAVWKHVRRLRDEGYLIDSAPSKGYRLKRTPDRMTPQDVRGGLKTRVIGCGEIIFLGRTDSTNSVAKALAAEGAPEGTVVVSEGQSEGRGRKGRVWYSPEREGIYASVILRPELPLMEIAKMPLLASLAIAETLLSLGFRGVKIKWPNDVLLNGRKVAGVLAEAGTQIEAVDYVVIGLGLNVNTRVFPRDLKRTATSLFLETGRIFERSRLLALVLRFMEGFYDSLGRGGVGPLIEKWKGLTDILGRHVSLEVMGRNLSGVVEDLGRDGALIIRSRNGGTHKVLSGDIHSVGRGSAGRR